jgi:hypothetical protein
MKDTSVIPKGLYCYTLHSVTADGKFNMTVCPYWSKNPDHESMDNGHCGYLEQGDWEIEGTSLLWDQCKECGINMDDENEGL